MISCIYLLFAQTCCERCSTIATNGLWDSFKCTGPPIMPPPSPSPSFPPPLGPPSSPPPLVPPPSFPPPPPALPPSSPPHIHSPHSHSPIDCSILSQSTCTTQSTCVWWVGNFCTTRATYCQLLLQFYGGTSCPYATAASSEYNYGENQGSGSEF